MSVLQRQVSDIFEAEVPNDEVDGTLSTGGLTQKPGYHEPLRLVPLPVVMTETTITIAAAAEPALSSEESCFSNFNEPEQKVEEELMSHSSFPPVEEGSGSLEDTAGTRYELEDDEEPHKEEIRSETEEVESGEPQGIIKRSSELVSILLDDDQEFGQYIDSSKAASKMNNLSIDDETRHKELKEDFEEHVNEHVEEKILESQSTLVSVDVQETEEQIFEEIQEGDWETETEEFNGKASKTSTKSKKRSKKKVTKKFSLTKRSNSAQKSDSIYEYQEIKDSRPNSEDNVVSVRLSQEIVNRMPNTQKDKTCKESCPPPSSNVLIELPSEDIIPAAIQVQNNLKKEEAKGLVFYPLDDTQSSEKVQRNFSRLSHKLSSGRQSASNTHPTRTGESNKKDEKVIGKSTQSKSKAVTPEPKPESQSNPKPSPVKQSPKSVPVPRQKALTNRPLIKNALMHVCLAGSVNKDVKKDVLDVKLSKFLDPLFTDSPISQNSRLTKAAIITSSFSFEKSTISLSEACTHMIWTPIR